MLIKVRLGVLERISIDRVFYYGFFPPVLAVGPISEYEEVKLDDISSSAPKPGDVAIGMVRIFLGLFKVFILSMILTHTAQLAWESEVANPALKWAGIFLYGLFFYFNFSGYSDMSIGAARLMGFKLKENFDNPYYKTNISAFWNSWHMSLTRWVNRYVYVPLGGMRANRQYIAIFATIMAIALWHDIRLPLVFFGIANGLVLVIHRYFDNARRNAKRKLSTNPFINGLKMFAVFAFISTCYPLLTLPLNQVAPFYAQLFGISLT